MKAKVQELVWVSSTSWLEIFIALTGIFRGIWFQVTGTLGTQFIRMNPSVITVVEVLAGIVCPILSLILLYSVLKSLRYIRRWTLCIMGICYGMVATAMTMETPTSSAVPGYWIMTLALSLVFGTTLWRKPN